MMTHTKKTIATTLPQEEVAALDRVRRRHKVSRAEALRESVRWYIGAVGRLRPTEEMPPDEAEAVRRSKEQIARGEYVRLEDLQNELGLPTK